jgi:hypothetical protein
LRLPSSSCRLRMNSSHRRSSLCSTSNPAELLVGPDREADRRTAQGGPGPLGGGRPKGSPIWSLAATLVDGWKGLAYGPAMFAFALPLIVVIYAVAAFVASVIAGFGFRLGWELAGRRMGL